jgi:hypothetical protein
MAHWPPKRALVKGRKPKKPSRHVDPAAPAAGDAEAAATASLDGSPERMVSMLESGLRWCSRVAAGEDVPDQAAAADLVDALDPLKGMHRRSHTNFLRQ